MNRGPGIDEPICLIEVADNNAVYYYHLDGLGSVVALSHVNRVLVERYTYDIFGRPTIRDANGTESEDSALGNPYRFTGRAYDAETALYYYRARYYDYATARFLQPDPTGYSDGLNLYSYCANNPVTFYDPMGLSKDVVSPEERARRNWAAAQAMSAFPHEAGDLNEYANYTFRNKITDELYPMHTYATGSPGEVSPGKAWQMAMEEIPDFENYEPVSLNHRQAAPAGTRVETSRGPAIVIDPDRFSFEDQCCSDHTGNPGDVDIDIYSENGEGDVRFYNDKVHGPPDRGPDWGGVPGTYVGNWFPP